MTQPAHLLYFIYSGIIKKGVLNRNRQEMGCDMSQDNDGKLVKPVEGKPWLSQSFLEQLEKRWEIYPAEVCAVVFLVIVSMAAFVGFIAGLE